MISRFETAEDIDSKNADVSITTKYMSDFIQIKKSQLTLYKEVPLYYLSEKGEGVLFKKKGDHLNKALISEAKAMNIYIRAKDKFLASQELLNALNMDLAKQVANKGVRSVRLILCDIVQEALNGDLAQTDTARALPETIEIMFFGQSKNKELFEALARISTASPIMVEHSVNVLALALLYCCIHGIGIDEARKIGVAALLHDIGITGIDRSIVESDQKLSDKAFNAYKTHTIKGHDIIKKDTQFDGIVATVALEHHEKLDGSGYPWGVKTMSFESQLIGLIDSYEPLTYRDKSFRKAKKPFDALSVLKDEVVARQYDKTIFKNLCTCLMK